MIGAQATSGRVHPEGQSLANSATGESNLDKQVSLPYLIRISGVNRSPPVYVKCCTDRVEHYHQFSVFVSSYSTLKSLYSVYGVTYRLCIPGFHLCQKYFERFQIREVTKAII